jgi:hypothetical protein
MAFTGNYVCTSWKAELGTKTHDFTLTTGDVFKLALYDNNASFTAATTDYTATNEIVGTGYTAGGIALVNVTPVTSGTTAIYDFEDATWTNATFTARGGMIYNSTAGTNAVLILDFVSDRTVNAGPFTVQFPPPTVTTAIIRIG